MKRERCFSVRYGWFARSIPVMILLGCLGNVLSYGLNPKKAPEQYRLAQWQTSTGLPSDMVRSLAQTGNGYIWLVTGNALLRFDGIQFTVVDLAKKTCAGETGTPIPDAVLVSSRETLWIGCKSGLVQHDYRTGEFLLHHLGMNRDRIRWLFEDMKGNIWICFYSSYVNRFADGKFKAYNNSHGLVGKKINAVVETRKGDLLFASREKGIFEFENNRFYPYPIQGMGKNLYIITMQEDRDGELWVGTNNGLFRAKNQKAVKYTEAHGLTGSYITSIMQDSEGCLWIGTINGVNRVFKDKKNIRCQNLGKKYTVVCLLEDRENSLWVGTYTSGLVCVKDVMFDDYAPLEPYGHEVVAALYEAPNRDIWVGMLSGRVLRIRGNEIIGNSVWKNLAGTPITAFTQDQEGNMWLGTGGKGVFRWKENEIQQISAANGLSDNLVTSIFQDSRGNIWFATFDGITIRRKDGSIQTVNSKNGLMGVRVHNIYECDSRLLYGKEGPARILAAANLGITVLDIQNRKVLEQRTALEKELRKIDVTCIHMDRGIEDNQGGALWIGTRGSGLKRFKKGKIFSFTREDGIHADFIYQVAEDRWGDFWLTTDQGIIRVNKHMLNSFAERREKIEYTVYGIADGLKSTEFSNKFSRHSVLTTVDGRIGFVTSRGISWVDPDNTGVKKVLPPVVLESVTFDGIEINPRRSGTVHKTIQTARFQFTAPTFRSPRETKFKYRLDGVDGDWISLPLGKTREAVYQDLGPGAYTFRVIAGTNEGVWNKTGCSLDFQVEGGFFQKTGIKIIIAGILLLFLSMGAYKLGKRLTGGPYRKKRKKKIHPPTSSETDKFTRNLLKLMETDKAYRDPDISLHSLAEQLGTTPHRLSHVLNDNLMLGFSDFINHYRIEEAKTILNSRDGKEKKITDVALMSGFNSKVTFYNAFRKFTGMTPSQYKNGASE